MAEEPHEAIVTGNPEAESIHSNRPEDADFTADRRSPDEQDDFTRTALRTPRRYEQRLEDDDDPVIPSLDAAVNTKI